MRPFAVLLIGLVAAGCNLGAEHDDPPEPPNLEIDPTSELICEETALISVAPEPNSEGFDTPEQAVESYADWLSDLPDGTWQHLEDESWILVGQDGQLIGRADVDVWTENAATTFGESRYWSGNLEYCP